MFSDSSILEYSDSLAFIMTTTPGTLMFVSSRTTRNKTSPKKARGRLRQSEVFFPLRAYHAIGANHAVQPGICPGLLQNRPGFRSCHRFFILLRRF